MAPQTRKVHPLDEVLLQLLPSAEVYAVGGRVRDEFRALNIVEPIVNKDLDYVVQGVELSTLAEVLSAAGKVNVVGASFMVIKFQHAAGAADIALPRRERSTGVGHRDFLVESGPDIPIADDLGRRDFRMNMIARRLRDGEIIDPYGGVRDIARHQIDIVAERTFVEDPLRILRAAQFAARFGFSLTDRAQHAMSAAAALVPTVSPERIGEEIVKLLSLAPTPSIGLEILREAGALAYIWPELLEGVGVEQNEWHAYDVYRHNLATLDAAPGGDVVIRLSALLHDVGKPRTKDGPHFYRHEQVGAEIVPVMLDRLRLSKGTIDRVAHLVRHHMYGADPDLPAKAVRRFINRIGPGYLEHLFALRAADIVGSGLPKRDDSNERFQARVFSTLAEPPTRTVRDLAIGGRDVIELLQQSGRAPSDFSGDRRIGSILHALFERVLDDPALNERERLLAIASEMIAADDGQGRMTPDRKAMGAAR